MKHSLISGAFAFVACGLISSCSNMVTSSETEVLIPVGSIKPEIDYSEEAPGCELAAQRIQDNVVEGMTLGDVRRLVGKPRVILPGSWWWTAGFSKTGTPNVRYAFGAGDDDVAVLSFSIETDNC